MSETQQPEQRISRVEAIVLDNPEVAGLQAYEYLRSNVAGNKQAFIEGTLSALTPEYTDITSKKIADTASQAQEALVALMPGERTDKTEALYGTVEYRLSELSMLSAARRMLDPSLSEADRTEAREWFQMANEGLYGKPDKEVFSGLLTQYVDPLIALEIPAEHEVANTIQTELRELLGTHDTTAHRPFEPSPEDVERIGQMVRERFEKLVDHVPEDATFDTEGMRQAIEIALQKLGGHKLGWQVRIVPNSSALAVSAHQKLIEVGEDKEDILGAELRLKILHEVGVHAWRSMNAERAGWLSAQYGQNGYLDFEEGLAATLEDAYGGVFKSYGVNYYLIAGLAFGMDNHETRDLRGTYEIMWRYLALEEYKEATATDTVIDGAKSEAFIKCVRLFRGTDMSSPGIVYLKDLSYFRGQELAWGYLQNVKTQEEFDLLFAGKLDLTKTDHLAVAHAIQSTRNT